MLDQLYWRIPERVLVMQFSGELSFEEFKSGVLAAHKMLAEANLPPDKLVHVINDVSRTAATRQNWMQFSQVNSFMKSLPEQFITGWLVIVDSQPNPMASFIASVVSQITRTRFQVVGSMDEAIDYLAKVDLTLALR